MKIKVTHFPETSTPNPNRSTKPQYYHCRNILFGSPCFVRGRYNVFQSLAIRGQTNADSSVYKE